MHLLFLSILNMTNVGYCGVLTESYLQMRVLDIWFVESICDWYSTNSSS